MNLVFQTIRLCVPLAFFGYALFANVALIADAQPTPDLPGSGLLSGGLTRDLDAAYKQDLPHMGLSSSLIGAARYAVLGEARQGAVVGQNGWLFSAEELRAAPTADQLAAIVATIARIETQLAVVGSDLVVVPLPAKIDIARAEISDQQAAEIHAGLYSDFTAGLWAQDVTVVDARRAMQDAAVPVFFRTDTHWTPQGAAIVAAAMRNHGSIGLGDLSYARTATTDQALTGDLISFVTSAALAPRVGLPAEKVSIVVQTPIETTTDIFGTSETDIVLVGTSYSANADWGFADALMAALGRDVINMAQQGLGPLQPMRDYLAGADFRDAPPELVIWEIPVRYLTDPALWPAVQLAAQEGSL